MSAKKIGTILFNPFIYIAGWPALFIGLAAILVAGFLGSFSNTHFDGVLDIHSGASAPLWVFLSAGIINWLCMSISLFIFGKAVSKTPFRLIDLFGTQAMARYPLFFAVLTTLPAGYLRFTHYLVQGASGSVNVVDALFFASAVAMMLLSIVWMIILMYKGYSVSCNIKGGKAAGTFIGGIIMAEILSKVVVLALMGILVNAPVKAAPANKEAVSNVKQTEEAAVKAAKNTLALIDGEQYAESWDESADFFKKSVKKDQWVAAMRQSRMPFGKLVSRELVAAKYMTQLPNAPAGEYVVIQFKTSFENKKGAIETFTPMLDQDGVWRMSGYFIK
jgi:hypothetical protein